MGMTQPYSLPECNMSDFYPSSHANSPLISHEPGSRLFSMHFYQCVGLHLLNKMVCKAPSIALCLIPFSVREQKAYGHVSFGKDFTFFHQFSVLFTFSSL